MADVFFGEIGEKISKATQQAVDKTNEFFESAKISAQIASEQKEVEKLQLTIGESVYQKVADGTLTVDEEVQALIGEIDAHIAQIADYKKTLANVRGKKVCPQCNELIDAEVAFCPKCGAAAPVEEAAEEAAEAAEEVAEAAEAAAEEVKEAVEDEE